jgi:hypothetical protein
MTLMGAPVSIGAEVAVLVSFGMAALLVAAVGFSSLE